MKGKGVSWDKQYLEDFDLMFDKFFEEFYDKMIDRFFSKESYLLREKFVELIGGTLKEKAMEEMERLAEEAMNKFKIIGSKEPSADQQVEKMS